MTRGRRSDLGDLAPLPCTTPYLADLSDHQCNLRRHQWSVTLVHVSVPEARRVIVATHIGLSLAFLTYWLISAEAGGRFEASGQIIVTLALIAELFSARSL